MSTTLDPVSAAAASAAEQATKDILAGVVASLGDLADWLKCKVNPSKCRHDRRRKLYKTTAEQLKAAMDAAMAAQDWLGAMAYADAIVKLHTVSPFSEWYPGDSLPASWVIPRVTMAEAVYRLAAERATQAAPGGATTTTQPGFLTAGGFKRYAFEEAPPSADPTLPPSGSAAGGPPPSAGGSGGAGALALLAALGLALAGRGRR